MVLKDIFIESLKKRRFEYQGEQHPLSANAIEQIVRELSSPGLNEGLLSASERIYDKLCLGVTVTEFIGGKRHSPTIPIIEWNAIGNNSFLVTEEMEVLSTAGTHTRRPDLVCFVNGLPLVVIEAKRPDSGNPNKSMINEGISQSIRNQKNDEIPGLFPYAQLLLAISNTDGCYATTKTIRKFWARWREEAFTEAHFHTIRNRPLKAEALAGLFADKPDRVRSYFERLWAGEELPTEQDRLLISLLTPHRLLEFVRYFVLYDKKIGKIVARYPQVFAVKTLIERVNQCTPDGGREGGVLWHTTGSGKSFTMVFLCKALLLHPSLKESRIIVVTDRIDLEKQLANTFLSGGAFGSIIAAKKDGEKARARSGKDLARRIGHGSERIIFSIINKFNTASKQPECYNPSDKLIVLVDEGHRSQGGESHERMRKALPNAAYIARQDAQETVDYSSYEEQIRRLVDKQVVGNEIKDPQGVYVVNELGRERSDEWSEEKTRNETDLIRTRARKTIEQELADDPWAQKVFSQLLKEAIAEAEALFEHPLKQYALFKAFEEKLDARQLEGIPESLSRNPHARAYYGAMRLAMGGDHPQQLADEALAIDRIVDQAVAEQSLNPQGIEAEIRKGLLPGLFKLAGMDKAKEVIDTVIHITRVGLTLREQR